MNGRLLTSFVIFMVVVVLVPVQSAAQTNTDGSISVDLGDVFKRGSINIEDADLAQLPSMPPGYVALDNKAYRITTEAEAVGPYCVKFKIDSVVDEETFKNLRIFHAEPERFDPDALVWIDRTISEPDLVGKTLTARSDELEPGFYVIGRMVEKIAPSTAVADLEIVAKGTPETVVAPSDVTYLVTVKNHGPDVATNVGVAENRMNGVLISATASQGSCKKKTGELVCKLGQLAVGARATITVVKKTSSDFPGPYQSRFSTAGQEKDSDPENNESTGMVYVGPDPNAGPEISLEGSPREEILESGATVSLKATATDPDGSIMKVEFYHMRNVPGSDPIRLLGIGSSGDAKHFTFTFSELVNGWNIFSAIATDNGGREKESNSVEFFVNGPTKVRIVHPKVGTPLKSPSDLTIEIEAVNPFGIKLVEIFLNGVSCGEAAPAGENRYALKVKTRPGVTYRIQAFVLDNGGSVSKTPEFNLTVVKK